MESGGFFFVQPILYFIKGIFHEKNSVSLYTQNSPLSITFAFFKVGSEYFVVRYIIPNRRRFCYSARRNRATIRRFSLASTLKHQNQEQNHNLFHSSSIPYKQF